MNGPMKHHWQHLLSALPRPHPLSPVYIYSLATARFNRHQVSNQKDDLDKSILHLHESILLQTRSEPIIFLIFFKLAEALFICSYKFEQPKMLFTQSNTSDLANVWVHAITMLLVDVLASQVALEASDVMQNIEEMVLCHELFTPNASDDDTSVAVTILFWSSSIQTQSVCADSTLGSSYQVPACSEEAQTIYARLTLCLLFL